MLSIPATAAALSLFLSSFMTGLPLTSSDPAFYTTQGVPVTGEDVTNTFRNPGQQTQFLFNPAQPFRQSEFDIRQYVAHPCYNVVGREAELAECQRLLGEDANRDLQSLLESGELAEMLTRAGLLGTGEAFLIDRAQEDTQDIPGGAFGGPDADEDDAVSERQNIRTRSEQVWEICDELTLTDNARAACFQDNLRLINRTDVPVFGNVSVTRGSN